MNQFILIAMNRENYTQAELEANAQAAALAKRTYATHASYAHAAAYAATHAKAANETYFAAAYAFYSHASAAASATQQDAEHWIGRYFELTGEDRSKYEQEIKKRHSDF